MDEGEQATLRAEAEGTASAVAREIEPGSGFRFLARRRGEALQGLMTFLGESGRHLDDRTRYLIYVAMQAATGSPRGLEQYIPKALAAGASEDEVVDAILQAYPAGGLSKVVDALDVFLSLGYGDGPDD